MSILKTIVNSSKKASIATLRVAGYKSYLYPISRDASETICNAHKTIKNNKEAIRVSRNGKQLFKSWKMRLRDDSKLKSIYRKTVFLKYLSIFAAFGFLISLLIVESIKFKFELWMMSVVFILYALKYSYDAYVLKHENCVSLLEFLNRQ